MKVRAKLVQLAGLLVLAGASALAATPPVVVVEPREDAIGLGYAAGPAASPPAVQSAPSPPLNAERVPSGNPLWAIPLRQLSATRDRPLFAPSRRPPPPVVAYQMASVPPPPPKPAEPEKPRLSLVGTIAGGSEGIGVFIDSTSRSVLRLKMGEAHDGWVLREVRRREATLEKGRQTVALSLPPNDAKLASQVSLALAAPVMGASQGIGTLPGTAPVPANAAVPLAPVNARSGHPLGGTPGSLSAAGSPVPPPAPTSFPLPPGVEPPLPGFNPFKQP
jgi:hypothetical protein